MAENSNVLRLLYFAQPHPLSSFIFFLSVGRQTTELVRAYLAPAPCSEPSSVVALSELVKRTKGKLL